jgi:copper resistance protein D
VDGSLFLALRFAHYAVLLGLFGLTAFRLTGLTKIDLNTVAGRFDAVVVASAMAAPFIATAQMLASSAAMMGQSIWQLEWPTIKALLIETSLGWAFLLRLALLAFAAAVLLLARRYRHALPCAALLYAVVLATLAWSGHAAASEGLAGLLHRLADAAHLMAAALWIGAIIWFVYLATLAHRPAGPSLAGPLLLAMHRFAGLGLILVAIIVVTGIVNAQLIFGLENSQSVVDTSYGRLLIVKVGLVGVMLLLGARNALIGRRYAKSGGHPDTDTNTILSAIRMSLGAELAVGISIVALVATITMMSPMGD